MATRRDHVAALSPSACEDLAHGVTAIVDAVRWTIGPLPRPTLIEKILRPGQSPEVADSGALIGRRIVKLSDRRANPGAAVARDLMISMEETVGDGATTAAIILQQVLVGGIRQIHAGVDPAALRRSLELGAKAVLEWVAERAEPLSLDDVEPLMRAHCAGDTELAIAINEAIELAGSDGRIELRRAQGRGCHVQPIPGLYWRGGAHSVGDLPGGSGQVSLYNPCVLVSDLDLADVPELCRMLERLPVDVEDLLIVASSVTPSVASVLHSQQRVRVVAAKMPSGSDDANMAALFDIAMVVGAVPLVGAAGQTLNSFNVNHLGRARCATVDPHYVVVRGGGGSARVIRDELVKLSTGQQAVARDLLARRGARIGRLSNGAAIVHIGGATDSEAEARQLIGERALRVMRAATTSGLVDGGGSALLACVPRIREMSRTDRTPAARAAWSLLSAACEAPTRQLAATAGYDPGTVLASLDRAGCGAIFDTKRGLVTDAHASGIRDPLRVVQEALLRGVSAAALCLTVERIIPGRRST